MLAATLYFADDQLVAVACAMIYAAQLAILLRLRPCMSLAPAAHERQHAALCRSLLALCAACLRPISSQPSQLSKACALVTPSHSSRDGCGSCTHRCGRRLTDRAVPRRRQGRSHLDVPRLLAGRFHRYHRESLTASDRLRRRRQRLRGRPLRRASALVDRLPVTMSIWITLRDATRVASNFLQTLPATMDDEPASRTMTQAYAKPRAYAQPHAQVWQTRREVTLDFTALLRHLHRGRAVSQRHPHRGVAAARLPGAA